MGTAAALASRRTCSALRCHLSHLPTPPHHYCRVAAQGTLGADVLVVLSALLATYHLVPALEGSCITAADAKKRDGDASGGGSCWAVVRAYWRRRAARILPAYAAANLLMLAAFAPAGRRSGALAPDLARAAHLCFANCPRGLVHNALLRTNTLSVQETCGCARCRERAPLLGRPSPSSGAPCRRRVVQPPCLAALRTHTPTCFPPARYPHRPCPMPQRAPVDRLRPGPLLPRLPAAAGGAGAPPSRLPRAPGHRAGTGGRRRRRVAPAVRPAGRLPAALWRHSRGGRGGGAADHAARGLPDHRLARRAAGGRRRAGARAALARRH